MSKVSPKQHTTYWDEDGKVEFWNKVLFNEDKNWEIIQHTPNGNSYSLRHDCGDLPPKFANAVYANIILDECPRCRKQIPPATLTVMRMLVMK